MKQKKLLSRRQYKEIFSDLLNYHIQDKSIYALGYKLALKGIINIDRIIRTAVTVEVKKVVEDSAWCIVQFAPTLENQQKVAAPMSGKISTERSYVERSAFLKGCTQ